MNDTVMSNKRPKILYKYRGVERSDFFDEPSLRMTPPNELNDPFEGLVAFEHICSEQYFESKSGEIINKLSNQSFVKQYGIEKLKSEAEINPKKIYELLGKVLRNGILSEKFLSILCKEGIGILSLSEENNNEILWSLYADGHKGFAIGLNVAHDFFSDNYWIENNLNNILRKVYYLQDRQNFYLEDDKNNLLNILFQKSSSWKNEKEWRIIVSNITNNNMNTNGVTGIVPVPIDLISEIIIGARSECELKCKAIRFCLKYNIPIKMVIFDKHEYKLNVENVSFDDMQKFSAYI